MWDVEALHGILTAKFNVYLASNVFLIYFNFIHSEGKKGEAYTCKYTHSHIKTYSSNAHRVFGRNRSQQSGIPTCVVETQMFKASPPASQGVHEQDVS